ncbi:MAG: uroporphyrinogen-III synthase [Proteobacteria bacterium]|nr:uroporphyrinogen-III synthase [Pseudomonadota bacterium]
MSGGAAPRRLLVTRPAEDAARIAEALGAKGIEVLIEPMLIIEDLAGPDLDLDGVQALLVTSANGARAVARRTPVRDLPVLTVGDASARAAEAAGFTRVTSAVGDVAALAALVRHRLDCHAGTLLHAAASEIAGDLAGILTAAGFVYRRKVLYRARTPDRLSTAAAIALRDGGLGGVIFFSPRTAATFVSLINREGLAQTTAALYAYCLSPAVAEVFGGLAWKQIAIAAMPDQNSLLALIDESGWAQDRSGRQIS